VTIYDGKSQRLIKNPINRYLINSSMLPAMKKNADDSLTLYVQKDSPGADKEGKLSARTGWAKGRSVFQAPDSGSLAGTPRASLSFSS
jgi:hypothetical protein